MEEERTYKISWNNIHDFKRYHDAICAKYNLPTEYTVNFITEIQATEEQMKRLDLAAKSGFLRYWRI
jgi:DNA-binding GntR family transcriptional regulator